MTSNYNYKFYGDFNTIIKDKFFYAFSLMLIVVLIPILIFESISLAIISFIVFIGMLIYVLNTYNSENNVILFTESNMVRIIKTLEKEIKYDEIEKVEFHFPFKHQSYVKLFLHNEVLKFTQAKNTNKNFPFSTLIELLLTKNNSIEIIEIVPFEKHKYFLHYGEVRKVQID